MKYALIGMLALALASSAVRAEEAQPPVPSSGDTEQQVERAIYLVDRIELFVEPLDVPRLHFMREKLSRILECLKKGDEDTFESLHYFHEMILTFRYSNSYFKQIQTEYSEMDIKELLTLTETLAKERKFDEFVNTHVTEEVFTQMRALLSQLLESHTLPDSLREKLQGLMVPIGYTLARAKNGDRPDTFELGNALSKQIEALYEDFHSVGRSHSAWDVFIEIQGLNEFYIEFATRG